MKEVVKVSIAGLAFDLESAAYIELDRYLSRLEKGYEGNPDGVEIIADIEARIVELILSQQGADMVVGEALIRSVTGQLGVADDLGDTTGNADKYVPAANEERFPKRLYRNPEGAKIGGVCSGLGAYFGVDLVWIRVGFFAPLLLCIIFSVTPLGGLTPFMGALFGAFVLLYFLLWIAIPLAKTPRQLLEMRGERVTASSIETTAQDYPREKIYRSASAADSAMSALGRILLFCIKAFLLLVGIGFGAAAIAIIVAMFSLPWFTDGWVLDMVLPYGWVSGLTIGGFATLVLAAVLIPMVMIVYGIVCLVFSCRVNRAVMWVLGIGWLVLVVFLGVTGVRNVEVLRDKHWKYHVYSAPSFRIPATELKTFELL